MSKSSIGEEEETLKEEGWENLFLHTLNLTQTQKLVLAIKCLQAVVLLHEQKIVYRDIKPENIMVRFGEGAMKDIMVVKLLSSKHTQQLNEDESQRMNVPATGTEGYTAPEAFLNEGGYLVLQNDIFSLGKMFKNDFCIKDPFINGKAAPFTHVYMLTPHFMNRPNAEICLNHFKDALKVHLEEEFKQDGIHGKRLEHEVEKKFNELLAPDEKLIKKLDAQAAGPEASFTSLLNDLCGENTIKNRYDETTTGSRSERKLFGNAIFQSDHRPFQMEAIQYFIEDIAGNNELSQQKKAELLHDFAVHVHAKIHAIHRRSRLAHVMNNLAEDIKNLNILPEAEQKSEADDKHNALREYIKNMPSSHDGKKPSENARAELEALMQDAPSKKSRNPFRK